MTTFNNYDSIGIMKNGIIDPIIFDILDQIASRYKISDPIWAEASGLKYQERISELRTMARLAREGKDFSKLGRAFSIKKLTMLLDALRKQIGGTNLTKELLTLIEKAKTRMEKNLLILLACSERDAELIGIYLETFLKSKTQK